MCIYFYMEVIIFSIRVSGDNDGAHTHEKKANGKTETQEKKGTRTE